MISLSSLLIDNTKFSNLQKIECGSNFDFFIGDNLLHKTKNIIKYFKLPMNNLENQKIFFDEVEMSRKIESPPFAKMTGFSLAFCNPDDNIFYPAISYEQIPSFRFKDAFRNRQNFKTFTATQKSIIAFKILVGLESIYKNENINYCFKSDSIYLSSDRMPVLFYENANTKSFDADFYWLAPEYHLGGIHQESTNVYSFGMFLYELLGDDPSFFTQSKQDFNNPIKTKRMPIITTKGSIATIISLCLNINLLERPKFATILSMFIKERVSFPGTDQEEFYNFKRTLFIKLDRKINLYFYSESNLRLKSLKGSNQEKYYLAKLLAQKIQRDSYLSKEDIKSIREEFIGLILSLVQTKQKKASKLYLKYILHHMSEIDEFPIKPFNLEENILDDPKASKLYTIYQLVNGNITPSLCSICEFDPIIQIEYASLILKTEKVTKEMIILAFCLLSRALLNPKLEIDSKYWRFCKNKLIETLKNTFVNEFVSQNVKSPTIIITIFICTGKMASEVEKLAKNGSYYACYFIARDLINKNKISDPISYLKRCMQQLPGFASYALGIVYLRSCNNGALFSMSACLNACEPTSNLFQIAAETMAEISYDNVKTALMYLNIAPRMTDRKKLLLALIAHKMSKIAAIEKDPKYKEYTILGSFEQNKQIIGFDINSFKKDFNDRQDKKWFGNNNNNNNFYFNLTKNRNDVGESNQNLNPADSNNNNSIKYLQYIRNNENLQSKNDNGNNIIDGTKLAINAENKDSDNNNNNVHDNIKTDIKIDDGDDNERKLVSFYENLPMSLSEANEFLSKNLYPLTILFRFCGIFLKRRFPHGAHETEMSYKARISSVQVPFILGCRYFVGFYLPRNYFLAEKHFHQQTQLHKNETNEDLSNEIYEACYNIVKYEDFREKVPLEYIEVLLNYIRKIKSNSNSNISRNVMTKEEMKSNMKNSHNTINNSTNSNNSSVNSIDKEQIKEVLETKEKIDKLFGSNLNYSQLFSIANSVMEHVHEKVPKSEHQQMKHLQLANSLLGNHSFAPISNQQLNSNTELSIHGLSAEEFDLLCWFHRNWKEICIYLKQ